MVEIGLQKFCQFLDIHGRLHHVELFLQRMVCLTLHEAEYLLTAPLINSDLLHGEHCRVNARPILLGSTQNVSFRRRYDRLLVPLPHLVLQKKHAALLFRVTLILESSCVETLILGGTPTSLFGLFSLRSDSFRKKLPQFFLGVKVEAIHA